MNKRRVGGFWEGLAAEFLEAHGVRILERNFHDGRAGEIDLIGRDGQTLIFVEVKYRTTNRCGRPEEAVTAAKQRTICKAAQYYLYRKHLTDQPIRFDVAAVSRVNEKQVHIRWIRDAFPYQR